MGAESAHGAAICCHDDRLSSPGRNSARLLLAKGALWFGDGLKGDLGHLEFTWTWSCGRGLCPLLRRGPGVLLVGRPLHEEKLLHEERSRLSAKLLCEEGSLRAERFLCTGRFPRARPRTAL